MIDSAQAIWSPPCAPMVELDSDAEVTERVRRVIAYCGDPTQVAFAVRIGVSPTRLGNVLNGGPLGKDMAFKMVQAVPGLTTDWLWFGNARGMPLELVEGLSRPPEAARRGKTAP